MENSSQPGYCQPSNQKGIDPLWTYVAFNFCSKPYDSRFRLEFVRIVCRLVVGTYVLPRLCARVVYKREESDAGRMHPSVIVTTSPKLCCLFSTEKIAWASLLRTEWPSLHRSNPGNVKNVALAADSASEPVRVR